MADALLKIGELAARAEVSARTIDYYTSLGLLVPAQRSAGNYRLYSPADVDRVHLVQRLEAQGIPLEEIATALAAGPEDTSEVLAKIDHDLRSLQSITETAPAEFHGLLSIIATRVHSLISVAVQVPPHLPII
ncbi:MerR family transcriptional regulator [Nocardia mangyaensis]|uniref:MerR family transcriptional regulator n=1 Tax=Nocardia mangyaensis TaxID=2213200 RepID=A0A1J0VZI9_9NOCA|nr:MerR family transcriptional regulator [Nocardia mangyaensis]APE37475.1 MerR family transcriptional regulator [Nocardia mangyaensis]